MPTCTWWSTAVPARRSASGVRRLDDDDRVAELARMLAGLGESDTGRAHARELLEAAQRRPRRRDLTIVTLLQM